MFSATPRHKVGSLSAHTAEAARALRSGALREAFFKRIALAVALIASVSACPAATLPEPLPAHTQAAVQKTFKDQIVPFVSTYCADCHGDKKQKGGVTFRAALKNPGATAFRKQWKQSSASVKAHDMPPEDAAKQPTPEERNAFLEWVAEMKYLSSKDPGAFVIRRLNKVEYGNTLHDLFGVDPGLVGELPDEVFGAGYLNSISPLLMEQFLMVINEMIGSVLSPVGSPPSALEKRLFGEVLPSDADARDAARKAARNLARTAFRRPAAESELDVLMEVFDLARASGQSYFGSLRLVLKAVLVSPQFLYITPNGETPPGLEIVPLDDYQLASRLSYLLWSTTPDQELSALADAGTLHEPEVLQKQITRLLLDSRSRALFDGFGAQWLGVGKLASKTFDSDKFPQMSAGMRGAMYEEARLFFESIVRENRSILSFVEADYTFLNGTLAVIYGLEGEVQGSEMRKVQLRDLQRGGILGMPGILAGTSFPNRTSPVNRGVWVLEQLLGEHVPPPPPNVPTLEKQNKAKIAGMTMRQRTELHRTNAACANCHKILDPIGFGLENFDAIGRWRVQDDSGGVIDAAGELPGGKHFSSPRELKTIIASRLDDLTRNLTERLLAYALCRQLEGYDEIVVDRLSEAIAKDGYRMQTLITEIVTSYPFTYRRVR